MTFIRVTKRKSTFDFSCLLSVFLLFQCSQVLLLLLLLLPSSSTSYYLLSSPILETRNPRLTSQTLFAVNGSNSVSNLDRELQRAREILEKSKAKLAARQQQQQQQPGTSMGAVGNASVPYFAATTTGKRVVSRDGIVKSRCEKTGRILADGEKMAQISEQEEWEIRSIDEVFQNEDNKYKDLYSLASKQLAERDVAASIWNLRQKMHTEDYQRIFDKKNHFIGEDS